MLSPLINTWNKTLARYDDGKLNWPHLLALPFLVLLNVRYLLAGFTLVIHTHAFVVPSMAASEYCMVAAVWLVYLAQNRLADIKSTATTKEGNGVSKGGLDGVH